MLPIRHKLADVLLEIPGIEKKETRDALLAGFPITLLESLEPRPASTTNDLIQIVAKVGQWPLLRDGTWPKDILVANARRLAKGTRLEDELHMAPREDQAGVRLRILHLSDLHMKPDIDAETMLQPLIADLRDEGGGLGFERLDYLVVSGDLTNRAKLEEFEVACQFISGLMERFGVTAERCIIVPGNHDLDWDENVYDWELRRRVDLTKWTKDSYVKQEKVLGIRNEQRYPRRFRSFSESLYRPLVQQVYPLALKDQGIPFLFPDTRIQFLAMNSGWKIDEFFQERSNIHAGALSRGLDKADTQIKQAKEEGWLPGDASVLRIAVWHHPVTGNEKIEDDAFLERLRQAGFKLCLHGHVHEERAELIRYFHKVRKLYVAGAGSFGAPVRDRPESIPRLYNLLEVMPDHSRIRVHTRCLLKETGAWEGWPMWPGDRSTDRRIYYDIVLHRSGKDSTADID